MKMKSSLASARHSRTMGDSAPKSYPSETAFRSILDPDEFVVTFTGLSRSCHVYKSSYAPMDAAEGFLLALAALSLALYLTMVGGFVIAMRRRRCLPCYGPRWYWVPLEILRSYLLLFCWLGARTTRSVSWRGHEFQLARLGHRPCRAASLAPRPRTGALIGMRP
jgi:hypothetical protein